MNMQRKFSYDEDLRSFIIQMRDCGRLDDELNAKGKNLLRDSLLFIIDCGTDKLSEESKEVLDKFLSGICPEYCKQCGEPIPWSEMLEAIDNGGYCSYCENVRNKIEEE